MIKKCILTTVLSISMLQLLGMEQQNSSFSFDILPNEITYIIISYLTNPHDMMSFLLANKQLATLLKDPILFGKLINKIVRCNDVGERSFSDSFYKDHKCKKIYTASQFKADTAVAWLTKYVIKHEIAKKYAEDILFRCTSYGGLETIAFLAKSGINTNFIRHGMTPLECAISSESEKKVQVIQLLIDNKANTNAQDPLGRTPLHHAVRSLNPQFASIKERVPDIVQVLVTGGAGIDTTDCWGSTPLMHACKIANILPPDQRDRLIEIIKIFLKEGANVYAQNNNKETALSIIEKCDAPEILELLKQNFLQSSPRTEENTMHTKTRGNR
jgi:hypothetical protein